VRPVNPRQVRIDHLLERLWVLEENGEPNRAALLKRTSDPDADALLSEMAREGLVDSRDGTVTLAGAGRARAERLVRRRRLAERLLTDVLSVPGDEAQSQACHFEHILSPEVTETVCTFLGHPPTCPHGRPIPRGRCCASAVRDHMRPLVVRLKELPIGQEARVVFITPRFLTRLSRLATLGLTPGSSIRLHQRHPSYVLEIGETTVALDSEIAEEIYVKSVPPP
jgi:DtxR family Mn-dependent transcriptional regulator